MAAKKIGILGAGGFTGQELLRILGGHQGCEVVYATSNAYAGQAVADALPQLNSDLQFSSHPDGINDVPTLDLVFLATPDDASLHWAPLLVNKEIKVVDIAGAFRLKEAKLFQEYYNLQHTNAELLNEAVYGMTEIYRDQIKGARLVANPGCYPSSAVLPLWALHSILGDVTGPIIIDAKSGTSGAGGRKEKDNLGFSTVYENFRAYKVQKHQHAPEINQSLQQLSKGKLNARFTPYLLPMFRGILCTMYLQPAGKVGALGEKARAALAKAAKENQFLRYYDDPNKISTQHVQHTNYIDMACHADEENNLLIVISAIDNLVKGAAGMAVQNMNLMLGLGEEEALL